MDWIFASMGIFIQYPLLAAALAIVLLGLGWRTRRRVAVGAGVVWLLYAFYEFGMKQRWLCTGECNIRIDLLLIYPVLLLGLVAAAVSLLRARTRAARPS
jgi:formate hydrogenlyase subunit 3/multisubunit Na+/H+ antiporter MnhD subunit